MVLDPTVLVLEADVAAAVGATLNATTYTLYGLQVPQDNFETMINYAAYDEQNLVGLTIYNSTDAPLANGVKAYQLHDAAYKILLSLPGYFPMGWFDSSVGNQRITPIVTVIEAAKKSQLVERDRAFNGIQQITAGGALIDVSQPGYGQTQPALY